MEIPVVEIQEEDIYLGEKGSIEGKMDGERLDIDLNFESLTALSNVQGEFITKDHAEKKTHMVKVKGVAKLVGG